MSQEIGERYIAKEDVMTRVMNQSLTFIVALLAALALGVPFASAQTSTDDFRRALEQKDREIRELRERLERLEKLLPGAIGAPPAATAPPPQPVTKQADSPPSPPEPKDEKKFAVDVRGYIKLDLQYADRDLGGSNLNMSPSVTPLGSGAGQQGRFSADARETRVNVDLELPLTNVLLTGKVQIDFYGNEDNALTNTGRVVRLREAYARGDVPLARDHGWFLLAGQTTSTFSNTDIASPDLVDANGPAGILGARQPQLKLGYKVPVGPADSAVVLEAAVQQHSFSNGTTGNAGTTPRSATDGQAQEFPLVAGKLQWLNSLLKLETAGAISRNRAVFDPVGGGPVRTRSETAWGVQVTGQVTPWEWLTGYAHYQHLVGLNREGNGDFADVVSEAPGDAFRLRNITTDGWYAGVSVKPWTDTTFNLVYGENEADEDRAGGFTGNTVIRRQRSIHVNWMQNFWTQWRFGLEYQRFLVDTFGPDPRQGSVNFYHAGFWLFY